MDETQEKADEKKAETSITSQGETTGNLIAEANRAADRLEKANAEQRKILNEQAELQARQRLGGRTDAGQAVVIIEDTPKDYAKKLWTGQIPLK